MKGLKDFNLILTGAITHMLHPAIVLQLALFLTVFHRMQLEMSGVLEKSTIHMLARKALSQMIKYLKKLEKLAKNTAQQLVDLDNVIGWMLIV